MTTPRPVSKKAKQPQRPRRVPLRTCVACHTTKPKRELLRIVHATDGHVSLDPGGKKSGRGAYLCARRSCWETALKKGRLEHEFEMSALLLEDRTRLDEFVATLPPDD